jgi:hypothetical protein
MCPEVPKATDECLYRVHGKECPPSTIREVHGMKGTEAGRVLRLMAPALPDTPHILMQPLFADLEKDVLKH